MSGENIKIGDVVKLKSGSPRMTVIVLHGLNKIVVAYRKDLEIVTLTLPRAALRKCWLGAVWWG